MYMTLYRKYRPKEFKDIYGEKEIIRTLRNSLKENRLAHAYLFTGPRGIGKTTTARLMAKALNCEKGITDSPCNKCENCIAIDKGTFFDLIEIDAASNRGIDKIRELKDMINYKPAKGRKKVYIIDEVHMLTTEAFNALLKTLEEPPSHVIFILATTEPAKILDTIISRCQRYDFTLLTFDECYEALISISKKEDVQIDKESIELIYKKSSGSLRDAISILEKLISYYYKEKITKEKTEKALGVIPEMKLENFLKIIIKKEKRNGVSFLDNLWEIGINIEEFFRDFSYYIKKKMLEESVELEINESIEIIEKIYETILKFKYEEDKRLLGYLIFYKILEKHDKEKIKEVIIQKEITQECNKRIEKYEEKENREKELKEEKKEIKTTFSEVKSKWEVILNKLKKRKISLFAFLSIAKLAKMEKNELWITFSQENRFHKSSIEKRENLNILLEILNETFNEKIIVKFEVVGEKIKKIKNDEIVNEMVDFFEGEIIEMR
ncbi:MAG: DNA polymerase III subunit gamma/tau [Fusobacteriia bacterium 4572_132]|nr:MAG: DNA polymerase III subunit gamma/tau [Fusobacteriia bacterium 4572_132]